MMSVGLLQFRPFSHWSPRIFTELFIELAENKLYMVRSLWGERVRINALFLFAFSSARTREANRTIRMQNSLPPRNLVNYPPNMGSSVGNRNLCLVKNSLEGEGVEELWLIWRAETAWLWLHAHYSPLWRNSVVAMAFLSGAKSGAIRSKEAIKWPWAPSESLALHPPGTLSYILSLAFGKTSEARTWDEQKTGMSIPSQFIDHTLMWQGQRLGTGRLVVSSPWKRKILERS